MVEYQMKPSDELLAALKAHGFEIGKTRPPTATEIIEVLKSMKGGKS